MNLSVIHVLHAETQSIESRALDNQFRMSWELEALGIPDDERSFYDNFARAVKFKNRRYKVPLL